MKTEDYAKEYLELRYRSDKMLLDQSIQRAATGEEYVLNYLAERDTPVFPKELSDGMHTSTARIAAILRHLGQQELIEISRDIEDGRRRAVRLSEKGKKLAGLYRQRCLERMTLIFEQIGEEEAKEYVRITGHILEVCRKVRK